MDLKHFTLVWKRFSIFMSSFRLVRKKFLKPNTHIVLLVAVLSTDQVYIVHITAYDKFVICGVDFYVRCTLWTVCRRTRVIFFCVYSSVIDQLKALKLSQLITLAVLTCQPWITRFQFSILSFRVHTW